MALLNLEGRSSGEASGPISSASQRRYPSAAPSEASDGLLSVPCSHLQGVSFLLVSTRNGIRRSRRGFFPHRTPSIGPNTLYPEKARKSQSRAWTSIEPLRACWTASTTTRHEGAFLLTSGIGP